MTRRGFTLAELLVSLVLLAAILAMAADVATRQWRTSAALDARRSTRAQLTAGAHALRFALRAAAGDGAGADSTDLVVVNDTLLELRAIIGAAVVCAVVDASTLELPPSSTVAPALTTWSSAPGAGDLLIVDTASSGAAAGDGWAVRAIAAVTTHVAGCIGSPFARAGETAFPRVRVRVATALPGAIAPGAAIHFARRTRFVHYRGSDGLWYLGQREWDGAAWSVTQPVAGPLRGRGARPGLSLVARDAQGQAIATGALGARRVARVDVVLRADVPALAGRVGSTRIDSLAMRVALRNTSRAP